jgi:oligopeptide/dipeptide ABC transporter ATP-binding protein
MPPAGNIYNQSRRSCIVQGAKKLLEVNGLKKFFPVRKGVFKRTVGYVKAVDDVSFDIREGETLGLVGESGCGKTTVGRSILRLTKPTAGHIRFQSRKFGESDTSYKEVDIAFASSRIMKVLRRDMQIIFQDPYSSLDPRMTVGAIIEEPLRVHGLRSRNKNNNRVKELMDLVGLNPNQMQRFPHEFSGGQRQRIGIARALALNPQLVVADESVSALDVSIRAQVINLLQDLQDQLGLTYLFIAHDLSVIKYISDRIAVMYLGKIVELADAGTLFYKPKHPYTEALISAVPVPNPHYTVKQILLQGDVPSPLNPPQGCYFHPRCQYAKPICSEKQPSFQEVENDAFVACHFANSLSLKGIHLEKTQ